MTRTITDVMEQFLQSMLEKDMEKWIQLWDQNAVFEHPYAPPGFPEKIEGKSAIYDYIKDFFPKRSILSALQRPLFIKRQNRAIRLSNLNVKARCVRRVFLITNSTSAL